MGTRADFYVGRGAKAEWIGSISMDGYPEGITPENYNWPEGGHLFDSITEDEFRNRVELFFKDRNDVTLPEQGWPWPWNNSNLTDYSYAFDDDKVYGTCFGHGWWEANNPKDDENFPKFSDDEWPDMNSRKKVAFGSRSGLLIVTSKR